MGVEGWRALLEVTGLGKAETHEWKATNLKVLCPCVFVLSCARVSWSEKNIVCLPFKH